MCTPCRRQRVPGQGSCGPAVLPVCAPVGASCLGQEWCRLQWPALSRSSYDIRHGVAELIACQRAGPGARRTRRLARWTAGEDSSVRHSDAREGRRNVAGVTGVRELTSGPYSTVMCGEHPGVFR